MTLIQRIQRGTAAALMIASLGACAGNSLGSILGGVLGGGSSRTGRRLGSTTTTRHRSCTRIRTIHQLLWKTATR